MDVILIILALTLVALVAVLLLRSARLSPAPAGTETASPTPVDAQAAAERLAGAIRFQTISHLDASLIDPQAFQQLHRYLEASFPRLYAALERQAFGAGGLLYTWRGQDPALKPALLMAHLDVVPVEPGTEGDWQHPPFSGRIEAGFIWGRGAMDDKSAALGIMEAIEGLLQAGFQPRRTLYVAIGHDEEVGGQQGAAQIAAHLRSAGIELEYVLDEGLAITEGFVPGVPQPVAMLGIAEKGFINAELTVEHAGGHSSMPARETAISLLAAAVQKLQQNPPVGRLDGPLQQMLLRLAPAMPFILRVIFANLWLFGGLVKRRLAAAPGLNANLGTTVAVTIFEAGVKENVLPARARAVVNCRIHPRETGDGVMAHLRRTIGDPRVQVKPVESFRSEPSPVSDTTSPAFERLERAIRAVFPGVIVAPGLVMGATDCRHYQPLSRNCYRFAPLWVRPEDIPRVHGTNERLAVDHYGRMIQFYGELIRVSAAG